MAPFADNKLSISRYWSIEGVAKNGISNPFLTKTEAIDALEEKILKQYPGNHCQAFQLEHFCPEE